jgi:hypothetical protein
MRATCPPIGFHKSAGFPCRLSYYQLLKDVCYGDGWPASNAIPVTFVFREQLIIMQL